MRIPKVGDLVVITKGPLGKVAIDGLGFPVASITKVHKNTSRVSIRLRHGVSPAYGAGAEALLDPGEWRYSEAPAAQANEAFARQLNP